MRTNTHELESGVFGRAVPMAELEVFTVAEQRRLAAVHRRQVVRDLVRVLAWVVCVALWVVAILIWRAQI